MGIPTNLMRFWLKLIFAIEYNRMPKSAFDYTNTQLYKLVCKDLVLVDSYVGHTTKFTERKQDHKHGVIMNASKL